MKQFVKTILSVITLPYYFLLGVNRKKQYLIVPNGIGEIVAVFMYAKEYMKKRDINEIYIVINKNRNGCAKALEIGSIHFVLVPCIYHKLMIAFGLSFYGSKLVPQNTRFIDSWERQSRQHGNNFSQIKELMGIKGQINEFSCQRENPGIEPVDKIFFNPYARTIEGVGLQVFEDVARKLSKKYKCYTFVNNNQKWIEGTVPLKCDLKQAMDEVENAKCLIGVRSGFIDLMSLSMNRIICIYPGIEKTESFFSFKYCDWNSSILEHSIQEDDIVEKICMEVEG